MGSMSNGTIEVIFEQICLRAYRGGATEVCISDFLFREVVLSARKKGIDLPMADGVLVVNVLDGSIRVIREDRSSVFVESVIIDMLNSARNELKMRI